MGISDWGSNGEEAMLKLARSFPSLANLERWDSLILLGRFGVSSHGERLAISFLLGVWNPGTTEAEWRKFGKCRSFKRFDLFEAIGVWDEAHVEAATAWIRRPFYP